jgi:hypothetical protein
VRLIEAIEKGESYLEQHQRRYRASFGILAEGSAVSQSQSMGGKEPTVSKQHNALIRTLGQPEEGKMRKEQDEE